MTRSLLTSLPEGWRSVPAKHATSLNPEVLPESTPEELELSYVDIAALEGGDAAASFSPKELTFGTAPSRARRVLRGGDTILSTVRTYLKAVANFPESREGLVASTGFAVLRPSGRLHPRFAYWAVLSEPFIENVVAHSEGVSYPAINPSVLGSLHMPVPPLDTQERIANFLDEQTARIDALIAEKEQLQVTLEELRQSELRFALTHGLDASAQLVPLGEQFIGAIPVHWRLLPWKRVGRFTGGAGFPVEYQGNAGEELPFFKVKDLETDNMLEPLTSSEHTVSRETAASLRATVFEAGTITFAKVGAALLLLRVRMLGASACLDNNMMAFIPNTDVVDPLYAQLGLGLLPLDWLVNPGAVPSVSASQVCEIKVAVPPLAEQRLITKYLASRFADMRRTVTHVSEHIARLREYRSSLISAAVTGQMDISTYKPH